MLRCDVIPLSSVIMAGAIKYCLVERDTFAERLMSVRQCAVVLYRFLGRRGKSAGLTAR